MTPLRFAVLNLSRRKTPTIIAIAAIAISVACCGILLRLNQLSENRFTKLGRGGDAIVGAKAGGIEILLGALNGEGSYPEYLPYKLFESLSAEQTVHFEDGAESKPSYIRSIIPFVYFGQYHNFRIAGTNESFLARPNPEDSLHLAVGHWAANQGEIILGDAIAKATKFNESGLKVGDFILAQTWAGDEGVRNMSLKISGILESTGTAWDRMAFSNLATAHVNLANIDLSKRSIWGPQVLNYFLVYLKPGGFRTLASLVNRRTVGEAIEVSTQKQRLENLTGSGKKIGLFVTILILALSALSVTSMLITRFEAMSLQLAVLRALGYKRSALGKWLLWEGFLLGLCACVIGGLMDLAGFPIMRSLLAGALPPSEIVSSTVFQSFPIWITAIAATTASVFVPLYRIYHQDVHYSLRE
jgi:putative ABC transport system permease protein